MLQIVDGEKCLPSIQVAKLSRKSWSVRATCALVQFWFRTDRCMWAWRAWHEAKQKASTNMWCHQSFTLSEKEVLSCYVAGCPSASVSDTDDVTRSLGGPNFQPYALEPWMKKPAACQKPLAIPGMLEAPIHPRLTVLDQWKYVNSFVPIVLIFPWYPLVIPDVFFPDIPIICPLSSHYIVLYWDSNLFYLPSVLFFLGVE